MSRECPLSIDFVQASYCCDPLEEECKLRDSETTRVEFFWRNSISFIPNIIDRWWSTLTIDEKIKWCEMWKTMLRSDLEFLDSHLEALYVDQRVEKALKDPVSLTI